MTLALACFLSFRYLYDKFNSLTERKLSMKKEEEMEDEKPFVIRVYRKDELAMLYNPGKCVTPALLCFYRWIRMNRKLVEELEAVGYNKYRHSFTPLEVRLIVKYLGEP